MPSQANKQTAVVAEVRRPPRLRLLQQCLDVQLERLVYIVSGRYRKQHSACDLQSNLAKASA
jgi:hypothetical protein